MEGRDLFILHLVKDMQLNPVYYMYIKYIKKLDGRDLFILHLVKDMQLNPVYYVKKKKWGGWGGGLCDYEVNKVLNRM